MKLRKLSVNQFKRFTDPTQLSELCDGLNLVVGPNELGKSTLLDALRAVLFERNSSRAQQIKALQNDRSGAAPVIELVFEVNGAEYTLTKRFVKSPYARLQCPDGTLLEADAAENRLRSLLGFAEAGNRGATSESLGMWGVLWVQQGQSFGSPDLPDSALASLSAGLESEVGTVLGGRRGRELPQVIEQQRGELVTARRRQPRGEYKDTLEHVSELEQHLVGQQQQQLEISETLEQLAEEEARLTRLEDGGQDRIDQEELTQAQEQLGEVMRHDLQLEAARSELQNRQGQLEQAQRVQSERTSRREELKTDQEHLRQETERLEELQQRERKALAELGELRQAATNAEAAAESAMQSETSLRGILDRISRSAELSDLLRRQSDVEAAQERLAVAQSQAEQIQVTDESLQRIRQAAEIADKANAQLRVAATRISFEIPGDRLAGFEADGAPLTDPPATIEAVEAVAITIPERGRILIEPAVADRDQLLRSERAARAELHAALNEVGAQSLADAQVLHDQRRDHEFASTLYIGSKGVGYTWEPSSRIGKGIHKAVEQRQGDFRHIGRGRRCGKSLRSEPQVPPHQRNGVAESGFALGILGARTRGNRAFLPQQPGCERNPGEYSQQQRSGAGDGLVGPLALSLHAKVSAHLLEGNLDAPAQQEPLNDPERIGFSIGADQRLRSHLAERVSDQHPPDMHGRSSPAIPDCGLGCNLQCACGSVLPWHRYATPGHIGVVQEFDGRGQALSLQAWSAYLPGHSGWSGFEERSIEPESADECDGLSQGLAAVQEFESRVSHVGHDDYAPVGQPAAQLYDHLARPIRDLLVPSSYLLMVALCGSQHSHNRQCPCTMRPGNVRQPHQADPAQATRPDQVRLA